MSSTLAARVVFCAAAVVAAILMLGPFQHAERLFSLTDKEAHALAFFGLAVMSFVAFPRMRKADLTVAAIALAASIEVAQSIAGREASLADLGAGGAGALMAWAAAAVGQARSGARTGPDRRQARSAATPVDAAAEPALRRAA